MSGCVYVADIGDGTVKIGCSSNPRQRLKQIENKLNFKAVNFYYTNEIDCQFKLETQVHGVLNKRCYGSEIFNISFSDAVNMVELQFDVISGKQSAIDLDRGIESFILVSGFYLDKKPKMIIETCLSKFSVNDCRLVDFCNRARPFLLNCNVDKFSSMDDIINFIYPGRISHVDCAECECQECSDYWEAIWLVDEDNMTKQEAIDAIKKGTGFDDKQIIDWVEGLFELGVMNE